MLLNQLEVCTGEILITFSFLAKTNIPPFGPNSLVQQSIVIATAFRLKRCWEMNASLKLRVRQQTSKNSFNFSRNQFFHKIKYVYQKRHSDQLFPYFTQSYTIRMETATNNSSNLLYGTVTFELFLNLLLTSVVYTSKSKPIRESLA